MGDLRGVQPLLTEVFSERFPPADLKEVIHAVEDSFEVQADNLKVYKGEFDRNIRFDDPNLGTWLIKVSTDDIGLPSIRWQESLLRAAQADARIPFLTPHLLTSADGRSHITVKCGRRTYIARVVKWIQGPLMSEIVDFGRDLPRSLGAASAYLTRALSGLTAIGGIGDHGWLIQRGPEVVNEALTILDEDYRVRTVRHLTRRFEESVLVRLKELPWSVIHHDLHDGNVVLDEAGNSVAGVIDFNDAAAAPRVSDLAIAGAYAMLRQKDPEHTFRAVVDGYRSIIELTTDELDVVGEMALMRLCMNWAQWQSRALKSTDNEYALSRSRYTWPLIEHLAEVGAPRV